MKDSNKCPYCSAPLQENATFCLHCMKSLDSKTVINKKKSKKPFIIFSISSAIVILILILLLIIFPLKNAKKNSNSNDSSEFIGNTIATSNDSNEDSSKNQNSTKKSAEKSIISKITDVFSGSKKSDENKTKESSNNSSSSDNSKPEDTESHSHKYTSSTIKSATCGDEGEFLYTCSCGDSYTEKISATGKHNFVAITKIVHHDEVGHYENVKTADAYTWYKCPQCSSTFNSLNSYYSHFDTVHVPSDPFIKFIREDYVHGTVPAQYEQKWIVDKAAYDEKIITGYKCSVCGKTK